MEEQGVLLRDTCRLLPVLAGLLHCLLRFELFPRLWKERLVWPAERSLGHDWRVFFAADRRSDQWQARGKIPTHKALRSHDHESIRRHHYLTHLHVHLQFLLQHNVAFLNILTCWRLDVAIRVHDLSNDWREVQRRRHGHFLICNRNLRHNRNICDRSSYRWLSHIKLIAQRLAANDQYGNSLHLCRSILLYQRETLRRVSSITWDGEGRGANESFIGPVRR